MQKATDKRYTFRLSIDDNDRAESILDMIITVADNEQDFVKVKRTIHSLLDNYAPSSTAPDPMSESGSEASPEVLPEDTPRPEIGVAP